VDTGGSLIEPRGVAVDRAGNIYIADTGNHVIRRVSPGALITTIAGTGQLGATGDGGPATEATLSGLADVAVGPQGEEIYVADTGNGCVRVIRADGTIATVAGVCGSPGLAGDNGPATAARLDRPGGIALDADGNLFIADTHNQRVRVVYR